MASGIGQMLGRFDKVMTIESSWCDSPDEELVDGDNRRFSALAMLLRARFLADVECWSEVRGQPIKPRTIARVIEDRLQLGA
jgi:2-oxoglutarate ferredoxin oxidoreductase subunit alpha